MLVLLISSMLTWCMILNISVTTGACSPNDRSPPSCSNAAVATPCIVVRYSSTSQCSLLVLVSSTSRFRVDAWQLQCVTALLLRYAIGLTIRHDTRLVTTYTATTAAVQR
jgi:hypothetical protein